MTLKLFGLGGGALAAFAARKALALVWEKSTNRAVPSDPESEDSSFSEVLAWTIISGVGVAVAQVCVQRYTGRAIQRKYGSN